MVNDTEYDKSVTRINSENIFRYLQGFKTTSSGEQMFGRREEFAKVIDLGPVVSDSIKYMYDNPKYMFNQQGLSVPVEQLRVIYFVYGHLGSSEIRSTDISYGTEDSVVMKPSLDQAIQNNGIPIIQIHTHPNDFMFTPDDYLFLIWGTSETSFRMLQSVIVACPGLQVMALATNETPIYESVKDASNYLDKIKIAFNDNLREEVSNSISRGIGNSEALNGYARRINSMQVELTRELGLKMYTSNNMRIFKEFTA